jgi:hypothetical protein
LFVNKAAARRPERQTSAVAAAGCFGGVIKHLLSTALVSSASEETDLRSASFEASGIMIIPIMPTVNKWLATATSDPAT